jgi:ABC-type antimicrobial peptide transport system permease subunit
MGANLVIRTKLPPASLASAVMTVLRQINPKQPANEFKPIQMLVDRAGSPRRFFVMLVASFAGLGLLLAALGIYGLISYSVTQRTQEIGIRMALGATRQSVMSMVLRGALWQVLIALGLGIPSALIAGRLMAGMLYGVGSFDPLAMTGAVFVLSLSAFVAGFIPARRAASIEPMQALRSE